MGKSLYIKNLAKNLQQILKQTAAAHVTIPLHGPEVTPDTVLELFQDHLRKSSSCIYHVDIAPNVSFTVTLHMCTYREDVLLVEHRRIKGVSNDGNVWKIDPPRYIFCCY